MHDYRSVAASPRGDPDHRRLSERASACLPWQVLAARGASSAGGAAAGALLGLGGAWLYDKIKGKPEEKTRSDEERAEDRTKLQTYGKEEAEEETK